MHGADHEAGRRAGTENVLEVVGLGAACSIAARWIDDTQIVRLRDALWNALQSLFGDSVSLNGHPDGRLPNTLNVSFLGQHGYELLARMPHIAASTREGQELVGEETAEALRDFLKDGLIRNAVNFPPVSAEEFKRLQPYVDLGERLGTFIAQMNDQRVNQVSIRYYGELAQGKTAIIRNAILSGVFKPMLSTGVTVVNAAGVAVTLNLVDQIHGLRNVLAQVVRLARDQSPQPSG